MLSQCICVQRVLIAVLPFQPVLSLYPSSPPPSPSINPQFFAIEKYSFHGFLKLSACLNSVTLFYGFQLLYLTDALSQHIINPDNLSTILCAQSRLDNLSNQLCTAILRMFNLFCNSRQMNSRREVVTTPLIS